MNKTYQKGILAALVLLAVVISGCVGYTQSGSTPAAAAHHLTLRKLGIKEERPNQGRLAG